MVGDGNRPEEKYFLHNGVKTRVTLLVHHQTETRLVAIIFKLLVREKLGYHISLVPRTSDNDLDSSLSDLSSCRDELYEL